MLANRLKLVLHEIISSSQSAFIPGRIITNNIIVVYEALNLMKSRKKEKLVIWVNSWVGWSFLEAMMLKLEFDERWVTLIMGCVTTVSYAILVNGNPDEFEGIKVGSLMCVEGFSTLINQV